MPAASIWFEIWGLWIRVKNQFFLANFEKFRFFSGNFIKKFRFSRQNWPFTAASGQIILFFFKSHHFRTYFLYMIRYNNISRPPTTPLRPPTPPSQNLGIATPNPPRIDAPAACAKSERLQSKSRLPYNVIIKQTNKLQSACFKFR